MRSAAPVVRIGTRQHHRGCLPSVAAMFWNVDLATERGEAGGHVAVPTGSTEPI
jgi:hypothetical protein